MYSDHFLPLLIRNFKLSRKILCLPFEFDAKSGKLAIIKSPRRVRVSQFKSILAFRYWLVLLWHFSFGPLTLLQRLQGFPFLVCFTILIGCGCNIFLDVGPIQVINSILVFEKDLLKGTVPIRISIA